TGSRPVLPPVDRLKEGAFYTNETLFAMREPPKSLVILGAGAIGLEMAQAFTRLGTAVTVIEASPQLLVHEDRELADRLGERLRTEGVAIQLGCTAVKVSYASSSAGVPAVTLDLRSTDGKVSSASGDALLVATGRKANVESLALERGSVATDKNGISVSSTLRTSAKSVWAAGDVTGTLRFTHVAEYEARLVVRNAFFPFDAKADYSTVPWVTFTDPELAHLGLTEAVARDRFGSKVTVWRMPFDDIDRAITDGSTAGLVKIIAGHKGRILGAHILGHGAGNMIGELTVAMRGGLTLSDIANTIHAYPTYPDAIRQAANQYQKSRFTGLLKTAAQWFAAR
ncbi:MAG: dihydrolipoyl dehydrogenase family protein, partial [Gemmatimonadaceae bacterium]